MHILKDLPTYLHDATDIAITILLLYAGIGFVYLAIYMAISALRALPIILFGIVIVSIIALAIAGFVPAFVVLAIATLTALAYNLATA